MMRPRLSLFQILADIDYSSKDGRLRHDTSRSYFSQKENSVFLGAASGSLITENCVQTSWLWVLSGADPPGSHLVAEAIGQKPHSCLRFTLSEGRVWPDRPVLPWLMK